ncbi:Sensor protein FixL [Poriferisphaera corsica]|uniref:histidine kinase n=1 Tax=Poriferisphaera corsica TaxID=2528020 RepID=A0A517YZ95_9BACT|nr:HAMP domain-containing sensor histidine kinase [Poriferisphaera corsica]QDU35545.1 Sensor protein FixL [Poriferisphaera corsica]
MAKPKQSNPNHSERDTKSARGQAISQQPQPPVPQPDQIEELLNHLQDMESRISELQQGLSHSHRLTTLGTITSIIAHEFNNLLTPIMSYSQLAIKNPEDLTLSQKANVKSYEAASRAAHIVRSMLNFARQEDSANHISCFNSVLDETLACLARQPEKDNIQFKRPKADRDVQILINPTHLHQVLMNLILNARKVLLATGGMIQVNTQVIGSDVIIEIADTGPGIPEEIMGSLFDPFVTRSTSTEQSDSCETSGVESDSCDVGSCARESAKLESADELKRYGPVESGQKTGAQHDEGQGGEVGKDCAKHQRGTGLGLYICKQLIEQAGGKIAVTSEPGHGATFTIRLPQAIDLI